MLKLNIEATELFDNDTNTFTIVKAQTISLEHSLVSLAKWEAKWKKPFLDKNTEHTVESMKDYIRCMTLTQNVNPLVYDAIASSKTCMKQVQDYIEDTMTATWFNDKKQGGQKEIVTAEIIYYWMIALNIPFECQKWHLNRLLTLIKVCNIKNSPPEKIPKGEWAKRQTALNNQRLKARSKL